MFELIPNKYSPYRCPLQPLHYNGYELLPRITNNDRHIIYSLPNGQMITFITRKGNHELMMALKHPWFLKDDE